MHLNYLPGPSFSVSWVHHKSAVSGVPCVSSGELISSCNPPGRCQPSRIPGRLSNWEPAHSLMEDAISGAKIAPCLLALAIACLPLCLQLGEGLVRSQLALLWSILYSFFFFFKLYNIVLVLPNPLFYEQVRLCLRLELFTEKFSLSLFFSLPGYPTVWVAISR